MRRVVTYFQDGQYSIQEVFDENTPHICIREEVWQAWKAHINQDLVFQQMFRLLDEKLNKETSQ